MEEVNNVQEVENKCDKKSNIIKNSIIRFIIIALSTIFLVFLVNYKKAVNNEMTDIYYIISIIGTVISTACFILIFLKKINIKIKEKMYSFLDIFYVFTLACALFQSVFVFGYFKANVDGTSMMPTFNDSQMLIVRSSNKDIDNFDVVVACYDSSINYYTGGLKTGDLLVKRVIGKAGDTFYFEEGVLYLNGEKIEEDYITEYYSSFSLKDSLYSTTEAVDYDEKSGNYIISDGYYFLMGDNRLISNDSRQLGLFKEEQIIGRVDYELHGLFNWEKVK